MEEATASDALSSESADSGAPSQRRQVIGVTLLCILTVGLGSVALKRLDVTTKQVTEPTLIQKVDIQMFDLEPRNSSWRD